MSETFRATVLTGAGGPEKLELRDFPVPEPGRGEIRVRVLACGLGSTEVGTMRRGSYPFAPKVPFIPGYDIVGRVEALGEGVSGLAIGERVAALVVYGGFGEVLVRSAEEFIPVPEGLDAAEVTALILNYVSAWQMIERIAKPLPGQVALVTGANGGVGAALLELLRRKGLRTLGLASAARRDFVESLGATWVESRRLPMVEALCLVAPEGVDVVFDAIGGATSVECLRATRRGGSLIGYGWMGTARGGRISTGLTLKTLWTVLATAPLSGRRGAFYGITALYRRDPKPFREDFASLLALLKAGELLPRIAATLPLLEARRGIEMLEAGGLEGKLVLLA